MRTMSRAWALAPLICLMLAVPAAAGTNVTRTVSRTYDLPAAGHGNVDGLCLTRRLATVQPETCMSVTPNPGEDHVSVTVTDDSGSPVFITVRQDGNPLVTKGCGTVIDFPIHGQAPVTVMPWAGPGVTQGGGLCNPGSTNLAGGVGTFTFYDDVPSGGGLRTVVMRYNSPTIGQGDVGGVCLNQDPNIPPQLWSCIELVPQTGEGHIDISVIGDDGEPAYFTVQQENNPNFADGCGQMTGFPALDQGPGGGAADPITIFVYFGPALRPSFDPPGVNPCPGSKSLSGTVTVTFYD